MCRTPSQATLDAARQSFGETVDAWSTIEIIRFGPVTEQNRLERVLFWPDRKGTGLKQVQAALAAKDPTAADAAQLAGKSVAMQGLGALEFVLYGTGAEELATAAESYRCAYGAAIVGNLDTIAAELDAAWAAPDGFASVWANPAAGNALYRDGTEAVTELMDVFVTGFELVRDVRLGGFLGQRAQGRQAEAGVVLAFRQDRRRACRQSRGHESAVRGLASRRRSFRPTWRWIEKSALFEFGNAANAAAAADGPIAEVLADPGTARQTCLFRRRHLQPFRNLRHAAVRRTRPHRRLFLARRRLIADAQRSLIDRRDFLKAAGA